MSRDVEQLLQRTGEVPTGPLDPSDVVSRARRRTLATRMSLGVAGVTAMVLLAVVLPLAIAGDRDLEIAEGPGPDGDAAPGMDAPQEHDDADAPDGDPETPGRIPHDRGNGQADGSPPDPVEQIERVELDVPADLDLRLAAVGGQHRSNQLAIVDLAREQTTMYPPGSFGLTTDAIGAVAFGPQGTVVVAQHGVVTGFRDGQDDPRVVYEPDLINEPGSSPSMSLVAALDGERVWLVQVGHGGRAGVAELLDLETGEVLLEAELPPDTHPVAATSSGLVLNQDGQVVVTLTENRRLDELTEGEAIAVPGDWVAVQTCETSSSCELTLHHLDSDERREVAKPVDGTWMGVAGPSVPTVGPRWWPAATSQGRLLLGIEATGADGQSAEDRAGHLVVIDPDEPDAATVGGDFDATPVAAWTRDGTSIVLISRDWDTNSDLTTMNLRDGTTTAVPEALPAGHVVVTAR